LSFFPPGKQQSNPPLPPLPLPPPLPGQLSSRSSPLGWIVLQSLTRWNEESFIFAPSKFASVKSELSNFVPMSRAPRRSAPLKSEL
jgi:hypothetical protein